ncbi:hypothetical protein Daus18300_004011 [Diaporthe australafricana]|uniref:FAD-binding PCMH-type domain-containing protein n=1 Tax=Diaporthe australafricana TaxID=127596 RepID=A0ABR3XBX6_9PEZI
MATLDSLERALRQRAEEATLSSLKQSLSDKEYSAGFDILTQGPEIGPGPKSLFGYLPRGLRYKICKYTALEPNDLFATRLEAWIYSSTDMESPLPCLESAPGIRRAPFAPDGDTGDGIGPFDDTNEDDEKYDVVLFCHSMYGMKPKRKFVERALGMVNAEHGGLVVIFHRDNKALHLEDLVCLRTASFPTGVVSVANKDEALDWFASFVADFTIQGETDMDKAIRAEWRIVCRGLGRRGGRGTHQDHLLFSAPEVMVAFTQHATTLPELTAQVPRVKGDRTVKNREALSHHPVSVLRPTETSNIQECVRWALRHQFGLAVVGGGHSGHCLWPNVVSIDMGAFDKVHIVMAGESGEETRELSGSSSSPSPVIVAEAGCKQGEIIRKAMASGLTVPLGARPSVGAGLWLQGGIGHLARLHGLACDAIVGAVIVSVNEPSQILCVGHVPSQHQPAGAVRPENEAELLWAIKGAGTNFGIVISVMFKASAAPTYRIRNWVVELADSLHAQQKLREFDRVVAQNLPRSSSADAYLYWDSGRLHLGVAKFESSTDGFTSSLKTSTPTLVCANGRPDDSPKIVDGVGLFDAEMHMSEMRGGPGHSDGKTSSFKRCLFLKRIGEAEVASRLVAAVESRPSPLCYLHLLQGGGAVGDVAADATAFGCRGWDFACVITGLWPRDQDGTESARSVTQ